MTAIGQLPGHPVDGALTPHQLSCLTCRDTGLRRGLYLFTTAFASVGLAKPVGQLFVTDLLQRFDLGVGLGHWPSNCGSQLHRDHSGQAFPDIVTGELGSLVASVAAVLGVLFTTDVSALRKPNAWVPRPRGDDGVGEGVHRLRYPAFHCIAISPAGKVHDAMNRVLGAVDVFPQGSTRPPG